MNLLNTQYDQIMRHYDQLRERNRIETDARTEEIYRKIPEIRALDQRVASVSAAAARAMIASGGSAPAERTAPASPSGAPEGALRSYRDELAAIAGQKAAYLEAAGYPRDYLDPIYDCPLCRDTGYVDGEKCVCFRRAEIDLLYRQYSLTDLLERENFSCFRFDYYSDGEADPRTGKTPRASAQEAYAAARAFAASVGERPGNLFLHGRPGVGKTFLAHCIMKDVLDRSIPALAFSAQDLFELLADAAFSRTPEARTYADMIRTCPLLVIDDLGTEMTNELTSSELFRILNDRILNRRSTILSTNLTLTEFDARYSGRTSSRVLSQFLVLELTGDDIRLQKRKQFREEL